MRLISQFFKFFCAIDNAEPFRVKLSVWSRPYGSKYSYHEVDFDVLKDLYFGGILVQKVKKHSLCWDSDLLIVVSWGIIKDYPEKVLKRKSNFFGSWLDFSIVSGIKWKNIWSLLELKPTTFGFGALVYYPMGHLRC